MSDWRDNLVDDTAGIQSVLGTARTVAVIGIKTPAQSGQPAYWVPEYLQEAGYRIIPVPVYYPDVDRILDEPVHRSLATIEEPIDLALVFRRSADVAAHLEELLAARPATVWMQSGIRNDEVARALAEAGIRVVQDRCAMVEHRQFAWSRRR